MESLQHIISILDTLTQVCPLYIASMHKLITLSAHTQPVSCDSSTPKFAKCTKSLQTDIDKYGKKVSYIHIPHGHKFNTSNHQT